MHQAGWHDHVMVDHPSPALIDADPLDKAVSDIANDGIAKFLMDADIAREAVDFLKDELGIPKLAGRIVIRGVAYLAEWSAKNAGTWANDVVKERICKLPYFNKFETGIDKLTEFLKGRARETTARLRPPLDADFAKSLSESLRDSLEALEAMATTEKIDDAFRELIARLAPQPKLHLPLFETGADDGLLRFYFGSRKVPFVGREAEVARLDGFMEHKSGFRWWLIHGPAGFGKSRLALELCLARGGSWRVGFLRHPHGGRGGRRPARVPVLAGHGGVDQGRSRPGRG